MLRSSLVALVLLLPASGFAADAMAPVNEIMAAVSSNWQSLGSETDTPPEYRDYFSDDFLARIYSKDFVSTYNEAAKYPAYEEGGSPFDYDVIAMGQDGCPLKDLKTEAAPAVAGVTSITATFDNTHCFGDRAPDWKPATVMFNVVEENGRPVIDDILRQFDFEVLSLKAEMRDIAKAGAADLQEEDAE
jgi:hypothetical protein